MNPPAASPAMSAARISASLFGVLAGIGGLTHAIGEMRQGPVTPDGLIFDSWVQGPIAVHMGGDPAMSLLPNLLASGIATTIVSLAIIVWSLAFVQRRSGGPVLILLSIALLLVGGGFGSPIIGVLAGIAALAIHAPADWWRQHLPAGLRHFLASLWPWVFGISALNGIFLMLGAIVLIWFFALGNATLYFGSFLFAVVSLLLTIITAFAYDIQHRSEPVVRPAH